MSVRFSGTVQFQGSYWTGWINEHPEIKADDVSRSEVEDALRMKLADSLAVDLSSLKEMVFTIRWN